MGLNEDLEREVGDIFRFQWTQRDGYVVPSEESIKLGNDAVNIDATVLYADLSDSTKLVDTFTPQFAAEIYKAFLHCCAKIIRSESGEITAYDGDRVMAVFVGDSKNTSAVRTALKINWAVKNIVQPAKNRQYPSYAYDVKHVVGIDQSKLLVARTGIRGHNDLVWVGRAANYAAKLCALNDEFPTWITSSVYNGSADVAKVANGKNMWEARTWTTMNSITIYRSNYSWRLT